MDILAERRAMMGKGSSTRPRELLYYADFKKSLSIKNASGATAFSPTLQKGSSHNNAVRTSAGLVFSEPTQQIYLINGNGINPAGKSIEFDIAEADFAGNSAYNVRYLLLSNANTSKSRQTAPLIYRGGNGWSAYGYKASSGSTMIWGDYWPGMTGTESEVLNIMSGKTVRIDIESDGHTISLFIDNVLIGKQTGCYLNGTRCSLWHFGGLRTFSQSAGDQCYNLTLSELRIYSLL